MTATATASTAPITAAATAAAHCCVVIVHYRGAADTLAAVASVRAHARGIAIVVIDNDSPDGSGTELAAAFADAGDV
ncbi:MAG TPA: hypothetical protein VK348_12080, partial [Planctomycetota bacterium]|nr:hypothetical protein [Planctomycetota bacterium]